jgi:hypothetical protein
VGRARGGFIRDALTTEPTPTTTRHCLAHISMFASGRQKGNGRIAGKGRREGRRDGGKEERRLTLW